MDYKGGKFKKLGGQGVDGNDLLGLSEAQLCKILSNILGSVLYNLLHPKPAPTEKPLPQFSPAKYSFVFPTFEPNDDELPLLDRDDQIKVVANTIQGLGHAPKYEPIVICTSRSMGKTFFMKKLVKPAKGYSPVKQIKDAYEVGHIVTMNTTEIYHVLANDQDNYSRFWQLAIAYNIVHLFAGYQVARINFHICNLADIIGCWKKLERRDNALLKYLSGKLIGTSVRGACQEMVQLTNIAFASNSDVKPVFLLDNVHTLARLPTTLLSTMWESV